MELETLVMLHRNRPTSRRASKLNRSRPQAPPTTRRSTASDPTKKMKIVSTSVYDEKICGKQVTRWIVQTGELVD